MMATLGESGGEFFLGRGRIKIFTGEDIAPAITFLHGSLNYYYK